MEDIHLLSIGRQFLLHITEREQLGRALQEAHAKIKELETKLANAAEKTGL